MKLFCCFFPITIYIVLVFVLASSSATETPASDPTKSIVGAAGLLTGLIAGAFAKVVHKFESATSAGYKTGKKEVEQSDTINRAAVVPLAAKKKTTPSSPHLNLAAIQAIKKAQLNVQQRQAVKTGSNTLYTRINPGQNITIVIQ